MAAKERDEMARYQWVKNGYGRKAGGPTAALGAAKNIATSVDAQSVGEELESIKERRGELKPVHVVDAARPEDALLHPFFDWDDSVAAERWRREQARDVISAVAVVVETESPASEPIISRAFISVGSNRDAHYEPVATVINDVALYAQVCRRACSEIQAFRERYAQFQAIRSIGQVAHDAVQAELTLAIESAAAVV